MKSITRIVMICALMVLVSGPAWAIPTLQLNIGGGTYDPSTQTIVTTGSSFTLYAYLLPEGTPEGDPGLATIDRDYYISVALVPRTAPPDQDLGSFNFAGVDVAVTDDMTYGVPPLEDFLGGSNGFDSNDLQRHGIYETYFYEYEFNFNELISTTPFDTQDYPGRIPTDDDGGMYFMAFEVDLSNMEGPHNLHFDLYNIFVNGVNAGRGDFAPFSHDAESVPEPGTLLLLGSGLIGIAVFGRKRVRR